MSWALRNEAHRKPTSHQSSHLSSVYLTPQEERQSSWWRHLPFFTRHHRKDLHPNLERTKNRSGQIYKPKSRLSYAQPRQKSRRRSKQVPQHQPTPRRFGGFNFFRAAYAYRPGLELRDRRAKQKKKQEGEEGEPPATPSGGRS